MRSHAELPERYAEKLIEAGLTLSRELSLPGVLQRIVDLAAEVTGAEYGALGVLGEDGRIAEFVTTGISEEHRRAIGDPPSGRGILGVLIEEAKPLRLADLRTDPRAAGFPPNHPVMTSFLGAPVMARGRVFGNIYLTNKRGGGEFSEQDEWAIEILAAQAGVAVENARLYEEATAARRDLERLAVMEDRERIARELHDGAIQALFAVGMGLQGAANLTHDRDTRGRIEQAVDEIDRVIRDLRNYIFGLRPGILADRQLDQAIRDLAKEFEGKTGITTVVEIEGDTASLLSSCAAEVVQLTREALSNVGRHSDATTCRVALRREGSSAVLEIDDDGTGFDPNRRSSGHGLNNMSARAEALGGSLNLASASTGTTVSVHIPL